MFLQRSLAFVHCFGCDFSGKLGTVKSILTCSKLPHAVVDCIEACNCPKLLFELILTSLHQYKCEKKKKAGKHGGVPRCDNSSLFVKSLANLIQDREWLDTSVVFVFANAERLRLMPPHVLAFLGKIRELTKCNVTVVTVSRLPFSKFYFTPIGFTVPFQIYFPNFTKEQIIDILVEKAPRLEEEKRYRFYCTTLVQIFYPYCRNLKEYEYWADVIWNRMWDKLKKAEADKGDDDDESMDLRQMWKELKPLASQALDSLFLRGRLMDDLNDPMSVADEGESEKQLGGLGPSHTNTTLAKKSVVVEMPKLRKLVLIACYLASYNQPKWDDRFFWKGSKKRKRPRSTAAGVKKDSKSAHISGPHTFVLPRIWPIYRHLINELEVKTTAQPSIRSQISSLVSSGLLCRTSAPGNLEVPKYKCVTNFESVDAIANYAGCKFEEIDAFIKCVDHGVQSVEFTNLVSWISSELRKIYNLEEQIHPLSHEKDTGSFYLELSSFLKELDCPYASLTSGSVNERLGTRQQKLQLLDFLCTELQAARMTAVNQTKIPGDCSAMKNMKIQESETAGTLKAMLMALGFPKPPDAITSTKLFGKVQERVSEQLEKVPKGRLGKPLFTGVLSDKQWTTLETLDQEMKQEYRTRSELLLKRLDVTIQSFSWSDRVKKMEGDMVKIYRPYRQELRAESSVGVSDLLASRDDLTLIEKTSGSRVRKNTQSKINKVLMRGRMPDRGGRPTEIEPPPPEMPPWQKDRAPQQQRGGGGYQQRGGGGGGRVQGGWSGGGGGGGGGYQGGQNQWGGDSRYTGQHQNLGNSSFQPQYQGGYAQQGAHQNYSGGGGGYYQQGGYNQNQYQSQGGYSQYQSQGGGYQQGAAGYGAQRGRGRGRRY